MIKYQKRDGATDVYRYVPKAASQTVPVTEARYREACNGFVGWCNVCEDFTRFETESDAEGYDCPLCESTDTVCGAEQALLVGKITIGGDDD